MISVKKLHFIWLQGEAKVPENYKGYLAKYKTLNPGWEVKIWDQEQIQMLISTKYPMLLDTWEDYPFWVMKVDLGKYCILDAEGGLLVDIDTDPKMGFDQGNFIDITQGLPTVIKYSTDKEVTFHIVEKLFKRVTNNNFLYIPYPNHPFSTYLLKRACCAGSRLPWDFKLYFILGSIGPLFLIDVLEDYMANGGKITWMDSKIANQFFNDMQANSWNRKKEFDHHDKVWICVFLILFLLVAYALIKSYRKK